MLCYVVNKQLNQQINESLALSIYLSLSLSIYIYISLSLYVCIYIYIYIYISGVNRPGRQRGLTQGALLPALRREPRCGGQLLRP